MIRFSLPRAIVLAAVLTAASACRDGAPARSPATTIAPPASPSSSGPPDLRSTTEDAAHLIEVTSVGGQVAGGAQRTTVRLGEKVHIRVTSDVADEVHVHTYDVKANVTPGLPAEIDLVASIPGRHEVELEKQRRLLLTLEVR